jgi:hypothetical protein
MRDKLFQFKTHNEFSHGVDELSSNSNAISNASAIFVSF